MDMKIPAATTYKDMLGKSNMNRNPLIKKGSAVADIGNKAPKKKQGKLKA